MKKQKEFISSEPTSLSFSHYKAAAHHGKLANFDKWMQLLPYKYGFTPDLWNITTDIEI